MNKTVRACVIGVLVATGTVWSTLVRSDSGRGLWKCVPDAHYFQAKRSYENGMLQLKSKKYLEAAQTLNAGLGVLDYEIGESGGHDDSGMYLGAAKMDYNGGRYETAAKERGYILGDRLAGSRPFGSPDCQKKKNGTK